MSRVCTKVTALLSLLLVVVGLTVDVVHPLSCHHAATGRCSVNERCRISERCSGDEHCVQSSSDHHHHDSDSPHHEAFHGSSSFAHAHADSQSIASHCDARPVATPMGAQRDECPPLGSHHDEDCALCQYLAESVAALFSEPQLESHESVEFAPTPDVVSPTVRRQSIQRSRAPPVIG